jgi:DnaJ-class molecular chaperone
VLTLFVAHCVIAALQLHPDKNTGNEAKFLEVNAAYAVLKDSGEWRTYSLAHTLPAAYHTQLAKVTRAVSVTSTSCCARLRMPVG